VERDVFENPVFTPSDQSPMASFSGHALIRLQHDLSGKPASTFPDHALIIRLHDLSGKPASTFPDHAPGRVIHR
jgi:hypothetical protein